MKIEETHYYVILRNHFFYIFGALVSVLGPRADYGPIFEYSDH